MTDTVKYLLYLAPYGQYWGGYVYQKGTPRGIGVLVQRDGRTFLFCKTFGAGADIYVGSEAEQHLPRFDAQFDSLAELTSKLEPALSFNLMLFDGEILTPDSIVKRGMRVLAGESPRYNDSI